MTSSENNPPQQHLLLDRFHACVRRQPGAPAVSDGQREYSYAEMHAWSGSLAELIRQHGVLRGGHVAVCAKRGAEGIASLLAVLQAGAVYVPLNPELPAGILARQIQIADIDLVLCQASVESALADAVGATPVQLVCDCPVDPVEVGTAPVVRADYRAYIIFTSGTTGEPKPVVVSLGNLFQHLVKMTNYFRIGRDDRVLQVCSPSFDIYLEEVLPSLCAGACVVIAPNLKSGGIGMLNEFMCAQAISLVNIPTALWCTWLDWLSEDSACFPSALNRVIIGSEPCPPARLEQWLALGYLQVRCINAYGLTETTITTCAWEFPARSSLARRQYVPVGQPLPGAVCHVLDENMEPCVPGVPGELYIGGDGVSLGYWRDKAMTEARFMTDPFATQPGERLYRTGDRALINQDGDLVVTGRADRQIKLRGHRIEPDAVEHSLSRQASVQQAVVCHCVVGTIDRLVAYLIPEHGQPVVHGRFYRRNENDTVAQLTEQLKQTLPEYAIPTDYYFLDRFPLTVNDKIDYKALPVLVLGREYSDQSGNAQVLASCLAEVTGFMPNDLSGRFFDIGGDSITAIKVIANLRRAGYLLTIDDLMGAPSLCAVADQLKPLMPSRHRIAPKKPAFITALQLSRAELQQLRAGRTLWAQMEFMSGLTPLQYGMLQQSLQSPRAGHYVEQVEGLLQALDVPLFKQAWYTVAQRHEILRTYFCFRLPGKAIQICNRQPELTWYELNWMNHPSEQHARLISEFLLGDRSRGFSFTNKPPFRLQLIQVDTNDYHFVWTYHHALLDGWSDLLILDEVFSLYYASLNGDSCILPAAASYRTYVDYLHNCDKTAALAFWRNYFTGLSGGREWLLKERCGADTDIAALDYTFSVAQTDRLNRYAQQQGVTLNTLFLLACGLSLGLDSDFPEVVIGTLTALRPEDLDDMEHTAGLFLNLIPARLHGASERLLSEELRSLLHDQIQRRRYAYISTDDIVAAAGSEWVDHLFSAMLIFENYPEARNATAARLRNHAQSAFPLNFYIWPGERLGVEIKYTENFLTVMEARETLELMVHALLSMPEARYVSELAPPGRGSH